jgi:hypothetical protein
VKSDVTDLLSTFNYPLNVLPFQGVSILGNVPAAMRRASLCCPFRAIKLKIPRKDYGKTKIPLIYYKKSLISIKGNISVEFIKGTSKNLVS